MERIDDARQLFRQMDATAMDGNSYTFHIDDEMIEDLTGSSTSSSTRTVEFQRVESASAGCDMALDELYESVPSIEDVVTLPDGADTVFTGEDGTVFIVDRSRLGYEIVRSEEPRRLAYSVISPAAAVKVDI